MEIQYIKGDATAPSVKGNKIIAHICNDLGSWGKGFVLAVSKRWKEPEKAYRNWYRNRENFALGEIQIISVDPYISVANMVCQRGIKTSRSKGASIRYESVKLCLEKLAVAAYEQNASVHMP